ncbi:helix-turn-helix domain-containing protein [Providencia sp. Je.9.19]|uniref:helix-turn-helix domain-containing protein n=1 Tax=Providencia sp. Je.9.19 TaxID=3142844 RepID=UPI003DA85677
MERQYVNDTINTLVSHYFKRKRHECGLTGKQMGELLCVSQQQISRYERGVTSIPLSVMVFFLNSYAFNLNDFFNYILEGVNAHYNITADKNIQYLNTELALYTRL